MPGKAIYRRQWNYEEQAFSWRRLKLLLRACAHANNDDMCMYETAGKRKDGQSRL